MEKIKLVYKQVIGLLICGLIYFLETRGTIQLGKIYNHYFYCGPDYATGEAAFLCYSWVDFLVTYLTIFLGIFFIGAILLKLGPKKVSK